MAYSRKKEDDSIVMFRRVNVEKFQLCGDGESPTNGIWQRPGRENPGDKKGSMLASEYPEWDVQASHWLIRTG